MRAHKQDLVQNTPAHQSTQPQSGSIPQRLQSQRNSSIAQSQLHPVSPHQGSNGFTSPHSANHGLPLQHHNTFHQTGGVSNGQPQADVYYTGSPYGTPVSGQYSSADNPELMATAHMQQRQYPIYHTTQSNSPASITSPQGHDHHGRIFSQPTPMPQAIYGFSAYPHPSINHVQSSAYSQHPGQPSQQQQQQQPHHAQMMSSQSILSHQQGQAPMPSQQPPPPPSSMTNSPRPQTKPEPSSLPQQIEQNALQRSSTGPVASNHNTPAGSTPNTNGTNSSQPGAPGVNPNAAPGPIPATTPLVVRQDGNGVQWIAFEYSRDRVKMVYTIRCDVESVNVDTLPKVFKEENCVYPRACCEKGQYKGNRQQYETECNTVGWSLAELNKCLRGKRGLIQRAVDSWRNSNQDSRLRSRRVRRMNKINTRKTTAPPTQSPMAGPRDLGGPNGLSPMAAPMQQRAAPTSNNVKMAGSAQLHHHHAHPDGSTPGSADDVSVNVDYNSHHGQFDRTQARMSPSHVRPANVFQGHPSYPVPTTNGIPSLPPQLHGGMDGRIGGHIIANIAASASVTASSIPDSTSVENRASPPPEARKHEPPPNFATEVKKRKYVWVDDRERNTRVHIKVDLTGINSNVMPDTYREKISVYPRAYSPIQMKLSPSETKAKRRVGRFTEEDDSEEDTGDDMGVGRTMVKIPMVEGREGDVPVPKLGKAVREREEMLNDVGYRMSWIQARLFKGRIILLQRSLDEYRKKMNETQPHGHEHLTQESLPEVRAGKKKWQARSSRARATS